METRGEEWRGDEKERRGDSRREEKRGGKRREEMNRDRERRVEEET